MLGNLKICDSHEMKLFCKDFVEKAEVMFIIACVAAFLVILSLVRILFFFFEIKKCFNFLTSFRRII